MNITTERLNDISIVRVLDARMTYPSLGDFSTTVTALLSGGQRRVLIDLAAVTYVDSATIGCLMDLYRQFSLDGGLLKLSSVQARVNTMLTMTGAQRFIEIHESEADALKSFEGGHARD